MRNKFSAFKKLRQNARSPVHFEFDPSLFPIKVPTQFHDEILSRIVIPSILRNRFDIHCITRLGQLDGMNSGQFLAWPGFGQVCLGALCSLLVSLRNNKLIRIPLPKSETVEMFDLPHDVLAFEFGNLNLSTPIRSHIGLQLGIRTVSDFLLAYENGKLSRPYFGTVAIEQVYEEIATLAEIGTGRYLAEISLETRTFVQLVQEIRNKLSAREQVIFDHRLCPLDRDIQTLEILGKRLDLTRERVRQIEKTLICRFQSGSLREFGWLVRRKVIALFAPCTTRLDFHTLLASPFFVGVRWTLSSTPAPFVFLDMVFYSTFNVGNDTISLNQTIQRRRNFT
jgi:hypothetical protein